MRLTLKPPHATYPKPDLNAMNLDIYESLCNVRVHSSSYTQPHLQYCIPSMHGGSREWRRTSRIGRKLKAANSILHLKINVKLLNGSVCEILSSTILCMLSGRCREYGTITQTQPTPHTPHTAPPNPYPHTHFRIYKYIP